MATAALSNRFQPIYNRTSTRNTEIQPKENTMSNDLKTIIEKVIKLQQLTKTTGFHTTRSISQLMANLTPEELVLVSEALHTNKL